MEWFCVWSACWIGECFSRLEDWWSDSVSEVRARLERGPW